MYDTALLAKSYVYEFELNGETEDEDLEDGETGFDDGSARVRNIRDPGQLAERKQRAHEHTHQRHSDAQGDFEGVAHVSMDHGFFGEKGAAKFASPTESSNVRRDSWLVRAEH